jgi:hypothetical protein
MDATYFEIASDISKGESNVDFGVKSGVTTHPDGGTRVKEDSTFVCLGDINLPQATISVGWWCGSSGGREKLKPLLVVVGWRGFGFSMPHVVPV